jgi:hypothetical protein
MDPAALGTTIIGLTSVRREDVDIEPAIARQERPRRRLSLAVRQRLANALRRTAERIEPSPVPAH